MNHLKVFLAGLLISWLGALPLGTLNVTAFDIAAAQGVKSALLFAVSVVLVELFYVGLSLWGHKRLYLQDKWINALLLLGVLLLAYLAINSFLAPLHKEAVGRSAYAVGIQSPIILGLLLSALNPLQFPFWLGWNKALANKKLLHDNTINYSFYLFGIGLGTLLALALFIWMGTGLVANYQDYAFYTSKILGGIYLVFALYLLYKLYKRKLKPLTE